MLGSRTFLDTLLRGSLMSPESVLALLVRSSPTLIAESSRFVVQIRGLDLLVESRTLFVPPRLSLVRRSSLTGRVCHLGTELRRALLISHNMSSTSPMVKVSCSSLLVIE